MIRIPAILVIAAVAASGVVSSASAQSFSSNYGTGNLQATHYDGRGNLINDSSQNGAVATNSRGHSAYVSPRGAH